MNLGTLTDYRRWYGRETPPTELRILRAGPLEVALDGPDLRYARFGEIEIVRRIYVAVRDLSWNTIGGGEQRIEVTEAEDSFAVDCWMRHRRGAIDFEWRGRFEGSGDGTVTYDMDGLCGGTFDYAKIGICIHHPSRESQGRPFQAATPSGSVEGTLPLLIGPQVHLDDEGYDEPLFEPSSAVSIELESGVRVQLDYDGSLFEMEDQRNWTDASFKSASTPAYLGYLHHAEPGKRIHQRVTFRAHFDRPPRVPTTLAATLTVGEPLGRTLPPIGFGLPSDGAPHSATEIERVGALRPDHLRADVRLGDGNALRAALAACHATGSSLELALFVPPDGYADLAELGETLAAADVAVVRVLLLGEGSATTPPALVREAGAQLATRLPGVAMVGGTNINFCDINRDRPDLSSLDGVAYSTNGQVHAFDERSLVETLEGQRDTVVSARAVFAEMAVVVSPVTLRPRFNPDAVEGEQPARSDDELPWEVDPRQPSLFCGAWTLGSVKALAEAGAASLTYFETVGWRGLFERDGGCPLPALFASTPGMVFPVYATFAALRECAGGELVEVHASDPLGLVGLAVRRDGALRMIAANLTHRAQRIRVEPAGVEVELEPYGVSVLDPR